MRVNMLTYLSLLVFVSWWPAITKSMECDGYQSCFGANGRLETKGQLLCDGYESCFRSSITARGNIWCQGFASCSNNDGITSTDQHVMCMGAHACFGSASHPPTIRAKTIECNSMESCSKTTMIADETVWINGRDAASTSSIRARTVWLNSLEASLSGSIEAEFIGIAGEHSLKNGNIYPYDRYIKVQCYGYEGGKDSTLWCNSYEICDVYCRGNCCDGMVIKYHKWARYSFDCPANADICPTVERDDNQQAAALKKPEVPITDSHPMSHVEPDSNYAFDEWTDEDTVWGLMCLIIVLGVVNLGVQGQKFYNLRNNKQF